MKVYLSSVLAFAKNLAMSIKRRICFDPRKVIIKSLLANLFLLYPVH